MTATKLADLLVEKTQQEAFDEFLTALKGVGFPTVGWATTSLPRRMLWAMAGTYSQIYSWIADIAQGGLAKLATGEWLTMLADDIYQEPRVEAEFTKGTFSIGDTASAGPCTITAGQLWFGTDSGLRYYNTTGGTLAKDGNLDLSVQSEGASAQYNVGQGEVINLLTPIPGVGFSMHTGVIADGTTPPTVTVSGTSTTPRDFEVEITTAGGLGVADFRWRANGGAWTTGVLTGASVSLSGTGVVAAFSAGTYALDDVYTWTSGATSYNPTTDWITTVGRDEQEDGPLQTTLQGKWSTLAYGQNDDWYTYWAQHEPTYGSTITRVLVITNPGGVADTIALYLATATGAPAGAAVTAIHAWMLGKLGNCTTLSTNAVINVTVNVTGTLYVRTGKATAAEAIAAATAELQAYFGTIQSGETGYKQQIEDACIYDQTIVRNVALSTPTTDTVPSDVYHMCVLGTVTLSVVFV